MLLKAPILRPKLQTISLADGLKVRPASGWVTQEKKDGVWALKTFGVNLLAGEQMRDGTFWVFDVIVYECFDCTKMTYRQRLETLSALSKDFPENFKLIPSGNGGEYLEAVIANGGEGVVFKNLDCKWGQGQYKCKREETFDCVVTARNESKQSLSLAQYQDGKLIDCGNVASLSAHEWDTIRVGDVVEIKCQCRHKSGKFREPRIYRIRTDKIPQDCLR